MSTVVVGDLVWRLVVDPTNANRNLAKSASTLKKQEKEMGGILGLLSSKWAILGGAAAGAGLAMVRSSPALSFAMEEAAYRFEYLFQVIGDQFAPLIEEVLIPALDHIIPLVEEFAPMIGEAINMIIEGIKPLQPVFERVVEMVGGLLGRLFERFNDPTFMEMFNRVVGAVGRIATALLDLLEPSLDTIMIMFEAFAPLLTTVVVVALETIATALELVAGFVLELFAEIQGNDKLMGLFEKLATFLSEDLVGAIETVGEWFGAYYSWVSESGLLSGAVKAITWLFEKAADAVALIWKAIETLIGWIKDLIGWIAEIDLGKLGEVVGAVVDFGGDIVGGIGDVLGIQSGGYIAQSGLAVVHRGEYVVPANRVSNIDNKEISVNITIESVQVGSDYDVTRMAETISREIRRELGMLF